MTCIGIFCLGQQKPSPKKFTFLHTGKFPIHYVILNFALSSRIIFFKLRNAVKQTFSSRARHPKHRYLCEYPTDIFLLTWLWVHNSGKECNNCNRSENRNQCTSWFRIIKFPQKNWEFWKSRLLSIPRNVKIWVPSFIVVTYTPNFSTWWQFYHEIWSGQYFPAWRTHARAYVHTNIIPVGRKSSFGANISGPAVCAAAGSKGRACLDLSIAPPVMSGGSPVFCNTTPALSSAPPVLINATPVLSTAPQVLCNATAVLCSATPVCLAHRHSSES